MPNINLLDGLWVVVGIDRIKLAKITKILKIFSNFKISFATNKYMTIQADSITQQSIEKYKM